MKVLVTGGLGYIGSHTVTSLVEQGYEPIIVDNLANSSRLVLNALEQITKKSLKFYEGDVRDIDFLRGVIGQELGIKGVIHFAAHKAVNESIKKPLKYYNNNVGGLISLCQVLQENQITNFVFSSSCTVYGETKSIPVSENALTQEATSPYGHTKLLGEDILQTLAKNGSIRALALRYFNPIGAHPTAIIGELPNGVPQNLVPFITQTAIGKRHVLHIFGSDYPTKDGTAIRDFIHVMDLANAHIKAMQYLMDNQEVKYDTFNIGTGNGTSVLQLIQTFEQVNRVKLPYTFQDRRQGDITAIYADTIKAENLLKWKAQYSLADALKSAWLWEQKLKKKENNLLRKKLPLFFPRISNFPKYGINVAQQIS